MHSYKLVSGSMEPTLDEGETSVVNAQAYHDKPILRGDVLAFQHGYTIPAKRVIGLPGDQVSSKAGIISVNGKPLAEPYAQHVGETEDDWLTFPAKTVPPGQLFVLGDNRNRSLDSRMETFGVVYSRDVIGKAVRIIRSPRGRAGQKVS